MTTPLPYTVVGCYPQEWRASDHNTFANTSTYVEHVFATDPADATREAIAMDEDREESVVIAVFEGHLVDHREDT